MAVKAHPAACPVENLDLSESNRSEYSARLVPGALLSAMASLAIPSTQTSRMAPVIVNPIPLPVQIHFQGGEAWLPSRPCNAQLAGLARPFRCETTAMSGSQKLQDTQMLFQGLDQEARLVNAEQAGMAKRSERGCC